MPIPSREKTFALENCHDLLRKLEWELEGLKNESPHDLDGLAFRSFNAAVTAWHLADWVWKDMTQEQRDDVAAEWEEQLKDEGNFKYALRHKDRTVALCREIATASKHVEVTRSPDPSVETIVSAVVQEPRPGASGATIVGTPTIWVLAVNDNGQKRYIPEVIEAALDFWTRFIHRHGIAR
jgi:hypothetical protein